MNKPIQVFWYCEKWQVGGIQTIQVRLLDHMPLDQIHFDIAVSENDTDIFDDLLQREGVKKMVTLKRQYHGPGRRTLANFFSMQRYIRSGRYDVRCSEMKHGTRFPPKWYARMRNHANRIVLISKALQDQFSHHVPENQIRVIYNGLEVDKYLIQDRTEHAGFHILLCGHLIAQKGHIDVLRAMNILNNRYGIPARLFIAGRRPSYESEHYLGELQKYIKENNLESSVTFLGEIRDMRTIRKQMDAEVVCGRLEAFGRVTVEAMLAELPVVGAISGCTPEIVQDGITGLLYPVEQADVLAEKLYWLYAHPEERREMGRRGKERAMNAFTIEKTARQVESLIAEVIAENKNAQ